MNRPSPKFAEAARLALIACIVALACGCTSTVRTSHRTRSQVSGEGSAARGADRSFETALLNALNRLLGDPRVVAYMKR